MPEYLSPGVYVEEVPSAVKPIAGVSTSTAAFVGVVPDQITILERNPDFDPTRAATAGDADEKDANGNTIAANPRTRSWIFPFAKDPSFGKGQTELDAAIDAANKNTVPAQKAQLFARVRAAQGKVALEQTRVSAGTMAPAKEPTLCTSFSDFTRSFGEFSTDGLDPTVAGSGFQNQLAHAVYGFFQNGGMRCYVTRFVALEDLEDPENWLPLEAIDEISIVAAPGIPSGQDVIVRNLIDHCEQFTDRFAVVDAPAEADTFTLAKVKVPNRNTNYGAMYFPYIRLFDMQSKLFPQTKNLPESDGIVPIPPSGHIAGIYSRVDHQRGVHKAPANEVVRGAVDLEYQVSRSQQDGLNPAGVNIIRVLNDNITVWGARTIGGDDNLDLKYVNVRRTLIFLKKSIDRGTQWAVFEPNDRSLWINLVRNITAFLTMVWRDGALFGSTIAEAFYVKCDDETNPPENRDLGRVTVEIGVAIVRPAEFVIFRISQWAGPTAQ